MTALLEVLSEAAVLVAILALAWNLASAITAWRYLRRRGRSPWFSVRVRIVKPRRSNVSRFPERNRAS